MKTLGIAPNDTTFNHLMTVHAKNKDLKGVEKFNEIATTQYGLKPSIYRYNALIIAYCKMR